MPTYNTNLHIVTWLKGLLPFLGNDLGLLPPIKTLAEMKGCSIASMHKAIKKLESEGLVVSKQGYGTFLKNITTKKPTDRMQSLDELIHKKAVDKKKDRYVMILPVSTFSKIQHKRISDYIQDFCVGALDASNKNNIDIDMKYIDADASKSERSFREILAYLKKKPVKGIMTVSITDYMVFQSLINFGVPCLVVDHWPIGMNLPSINPNHSDATKELVYVLASLKHKNIALMDRPDPRLNPELASGYKAGLAATGLDFQESMMFNISSGFFARAEQISKFEKFMLSDKHPTAFITYTSDIAVELIKVFNRLGMKVPYDISIVTYCSNQVEFNGMILSGISYDWSGIGSYSVGKLLEISEKKGNALFDENYKFSFLPGSSISFNHSKLSPAKS